MEELSLKEVFSYFKSKLLWILIAIISIVIIGNVVTILTRTPMYKSNTTIVLVNEKKNNYSQSDLQLNNNLVGTYSEIIKSRKVMTKVIDNLKLDYSIGQLSSNVSVSSVEDTQIIKISVSDKNAKRATKITDEIAKTFASEIKGIYHLENVSIVDKAITSKEPYNINYVKDNIIYLVIGVALSFGVVFVMYYFDTSIKSSEVVEEKLGLTVLGIVPKEDKE